MKKITSTFLKMKGAAILFAVFLLPATEFIMAHGTVTSPASRIWNCKQEGENPSSGGCQAAAQFSVSYIYDWNGVRQGNAGGNHRALLPDGQLASGGDQYFRGLDLTGVNWKATPVTAGPLTVTWTNSAAHVTQYYRVYVTKTGWDPSQPLTWDSLELIADSGPRPQENTANIPVVMPVRTGKHVLFSVWQRSDSPEAFYSTSDIDYGGGGGGGNVGPTVSLSSPSDGASFSVGDQVRLTANASDSDGSISQVAFSVNGSEVATDTSAPYEYVWTATEGDITFSASARDNDGAFVTSAIVSVSVTAPNGGGNAPPQVTVTSPDNNTSFQVSDQVRIVADVSDADGSIVSVSFFADGDEIGTVTSPPYEFNWTATEGDLTLAASATDNEGASTRSASVAVSVTIDGGGGSGACDDIANWESAEVYLGGTQVSFNNVIYEAKWWTRNQNPENNSTIWAVWKVVGACGEASAAQATSADESFSVLYPNPSADAVTIQSDGGDSTVKVMDASGREVLSDDVKSGESIDISNLSDGIYFVEIYKDGVKETSKRIIKE